MKIEKVDFIKSWFSEYTATFYDIQEPDLSNIRLKEEHTYKVCEAIDTLTADENMSDSDRNIASVIAMLHDVGRFPQFRRWGTFRDSISDNHARLSIEVIREHRILKDIDPKKELIIEEGVRFHNLLHLPKRFKSLDDKFIKLIRDADKLDIWRVFTDFYNTDPDKRPSAVTLGFPDPPEVSADCLKRINDGRVVELATVKSVNDFILLLMSWVYDLNFVSSYRILDDNGYYATLAQKLPKTTEVAETLDIIYKKLKDEQGKN